MHYAYLLLTDLENPATLRMKQLGAALIDRGVRVSYVVKDTPASRPRPGVHPDAHVEFVPEPNVLAGAAARRRALKTLAPDFVEVLNPHPKTLLPLAGLGRIRVVALWDEPRFVHPIGRANLLAQRTWNRWLLRRAWLRVVAARQLQDLFRDRWNVDTVYLPHVTYVTADQPRPSPFDAPTAVYLGNYFPVWDHDVVFQAARLLKDRGLTPPICMVGDGPDRPRWEAFVREHDLKNVRIAGFLPEADMWAHLRNAHVLLFPMRDTLLNRSRCSSKLFAYAQSRRPAIASRVGEVPQVLGDHPTYVDPTPEAFANAIATAIAAPRAPDVDYDLARLSPATRADQLLHAIRAREAQDGRSLPPSTDRPA